MNKYLYAFFIFDCFILVGFLAGVFFGNGIKSCTEKACLCQSEGELNCNSCASEDLIFALGIVNIAKVCSAEEVLICKDKEFVSRRYDIKDDCSIEASWFNFVVHYLE